MHNIIRICIYKSFYNLLNDHRSCGSGICAKLQRDLEDLARQNQETMNLAIVDLEKKPEFKEMYGITRIPTTRAYFKGDVEDQVQGPGWTSISKMVERVLGAR